VDIGDAVEAPGRMTFGQLVGVPALLQMFGCELAHGLQQPNRWPNGLRDAGTPLPSSAFLMSPYADLTLSGETIFKNQAIDPILTPEGLRLRLPDYVGRADASNPQISPVFGDLSGLPPLLIQVGSHEILLSDALRLASRAAIDEVPVTLEVTPGAPHVFQGFAAVLDEGDAALDRASTFLKTQFAAAQRN
jgi:monoterpene epsilon-lactone hydrolase